MLLSFQPACRLCCLEESSIQSTWASRLGAGVSWRGSEFGSPALRPRYRPAPAGGCEQRTGERVRSGQQQRQLAGGFAARFGRCPIHMIIGESAGSASSGRLLSALGLAWVTPRIAVGRRPNRSSKNSNQHGKQPAHLFASRPAAMGKKWANSTKIARLATGKSTLPTVK